MKTRQLSEFLGGREGRSGVRRSDFTRLTGLKTDALNNLVRRDQFPFLRDDQPDEGGWGAYAAQTVMKTKIAFALSQAGATQYEAGHFVAQEYGMLFAAGPGRVSNTDEPLFFGYFDSTSEEFDEEQKRTVRANARIPVCGSWVEVGRTMAAHAERHGTAIATAVLVNATAELGLLRKSARSFGMADEVFADDQLATEVSNE